MIFHVVAIKELFWKRFTIDLLFFWLNEEKIRDILREYKLIALELYEYQKEKVWQYWIIKILIDFQWENIVLLTNATDIENVVYQLSLVWFDIKNINYVNESKKIEENAVNAVMKAEKEKASKWIEEQNDIVEKKKKKDEEIFDNQRLLRTQNLWKQLLEEIPVFLDKAGDIISKAELKALHDQLQELSKLEMWSNTEKMASYLEEIYNNYSKLQQKYLTIHESPNIDVSWSVISNAYLTSEIAKLEKAKDLQKVWWAKSSEDTLYAMLWWMLLYFKLIKRDFLAKLRNFSLDFSKIFWYLSLSFFIITLLSAIYISIINKNDFVFVIMVYSWVFWLVLYWIKSIKVLQAIQGKKMLFSVLLLLWSILGSLFIIRILKQFFIF